MPFSLDASAFHGLLRSFLDEDLGSGDITTNSVVPFRRRARGELKAKAPLILAGVDLFAEVFRLLDSASEVEFFRRDGEQVEPGQTPAAIQSSASTLLKGERVALNLLQRLSGVATLTHRFVEAIAGTGAKILDTRKTTPGLRALEKYAVRVGGGQNHRKDLAQAVLIKENHIRLGGGVSAALQAAQAARGRASWIEIEVTNLDELRSTFAHHVDVVLLDNMGPATVREAVNILRKHDPAHRISVEASGGITIDNVRDYANAGVDWISVGALTHSAPAVDLSFEIEPLDD